MNICSEIFFIVHAIQYPLNLPIYAIAIIDIHAMYPKT